MTSQEVTSFKCCLTARPVSQKGLVPFGSDNVTEGLWLISNLNFSMLFNGFISDILFKTILRGTLETHSTSVDGDGRCLHVVL